MSFIYDCILPECGGMNASGYCSIFIAFKSIPNSSIRPRRTVSFDGHGHSFNVCVVCFVCFPLDCLLFDDFSVLILLLCVLTVCLLLKRSACQIKSCTVRARMFIALIYRKRMEQTEYLIRMVWLDLHALILIRRFSIKTLIIETKLKETHRDKETHTHRTWPALVLLLLPRSVRSRSPSCSGEILIWFNI